jgi:hypothetical protein
MNAANRAKNQIEQNQPAIVVLKPILRASSGIIANKVKAATQAKGFASQAIRWKASGETPKPLLSHPEW